MHKIFLLEESTPFYAYTYSLKCNTLKVVAFHIVKSFLNQNNLTI